MHWRAIFQDQSVGSQTTKRQVSNYFTANLTLFYRVVVVLESRVYVYNFADLRLIDAIDTCSNPKGLCALNPDGKNAVLCTPASQKGFVRVALYHETNTNTSFKAHDNMIDAMALTNDGTILVTASEVGTIFRLFFTNQKGSTGPTQPF
jgi:WD repeat-containing protein 45